MKYRRWRKLRSFGFRNATVQSYGSVPMLDPYVKYQQYIHSTYFSKNFTILSHSKRWHESFKKAKTDGYTPPLQIGKIQLLKYITIIYCFGQAYRIF